MGFTGLLGMIAVTVLFWEKVGGSTLLSQTQADLSWSVTPETEYVLLPEVLNVIWEDYITYWLHTEFMWPVVSLHSKTLGLEVEVSQFFKSTIWFDFWF